LHVHPLNLNQLSTDVKILPSTQSSPKATNFMAWGAHAPSHVAVGAPADRFFRVI
jgi:hypothetical protein